MAPCLTDEINYPIVTIIITPPFLLWPIYLIPLCGAGVAHLVSGNTVLANCWGFPIQTHCGLEREFVSFVRSSILFKVVVCILASIIIIQPGWHQKNWAWPGHWAPRPMSGFLSKRVAKVFNGKWCWHWVYHQLIIIMIVIAISDRFVFKYVFIFGIPDDSFKGYREVDARPSNENYHHHHKTKHSLSWQIFN